MAGAAPLTGAVLQGSAGAVRPGRSSSRSAARPKPRPGRAGAAGSRVPSTMLQAEQRRAARRRTAYGRAPAPRHGVGDGSRRPGRRGSGRASRGPAASTGGSRVSQPLPAVHRGVGEVVQRLPAGQHPADEVVTDRERAAEQEVGDGHQAEQGHDGGSRKAVVRCATSRPRTSPAAAGSDPGEAEEVGAEAVEGDGRRAAAAKAASTRWPRVGRSRPTRVRSLLTGRWSTTRARIIPARGPRTASSGVAAGVPAAGCGRPQRGSGVGGHTSTPLARTARRS